MPASWNSGQLPRRKSALLMAVVAGYRGLLRGVEVLVEISVACAAVVVVGLGQVLKLARLVELGSILALGGLAALLVALDAMLHFAVGGQAGDRLMLGVVMALPAPVGESLGVLLDVFIGMRLVVELDHRLGARRTAFFL